MNNTATTHRPLVRTLAEVLETAAPFMRPKDKTGLDARGHVFLCLIFDTYGQRSEFLAEHKRTWVTTDDRATYLSYSCDWDDAQGPGLMLTCWASAYERNAK